jgi:hypothetical protein
MQEINEEEVKATVVKRISPYIVPPLDNFVRPSDIAGAAVEAFHRLEKDLAEKVKRAEARLAEAQKDLEQAKRELALRTSNPEQFIYKTAEEIAIMKLNSARATILKQMKAFEDGASPLLKSSIKKAIQ